MTTYAYCRVSSDRQVDNNGTDAQRHAITAWATSQGVQIAEGDWYADDGVSGKSMSRAGWEAMIAKLQKGDAVVLYDLSRAGRTLLGLCQWFEDMGAREVRVVFVKDGLDLGTAFGKMTAQIMGAICEWQRQDIIAKSRQGIRARIARGQKWGGSLVVRNARGCSRLTDEGWLEVGRRFWSKEAKLLDLSRETGMTVASISRKLIKLRKRGH